MEFEILKWLVEQSGAVALAILALLMLRKSYEDRLANKKEWIEQYERDCQDLQRVVEENTRVIGAVLEQLRKMPDVK